MLYVNIDSLMSWIDKRFTANNTVLVLRQMFISVFVLAQLMSNKGILFANDANVERAKAIVGNIHRMGIVNCVISTYDGRKLPKVKQ